MAAVEYLKSNVKRSQIGPKPDIVLTPIQMKPKRYKICLKNRFFWPLFWPYLNGSRCAGFKGLTVTDITVACSSSEAYAVVLLAQMSGWKRNRCFWPVIPIFSRLTCSSEDCGAEIKTKVGNPSRSCCMVLEAARRTTQSVASVRTSVLRYLKRPFLSGKAVNQGSTTKLTTMLHSREVAVFDPM